MLTQLYQYEQHRKGRRNFPRDTTTTLWRKGIIVEEEFIISYGLLLVLSLKKFLYMWIQKYTDNIWVL